MAEQFGAMVELPRTGAIAKKGTVAGEPQMLPSKAKNSRP
jgi:hypothetical protein